MKKIFTQDEIKKYISSGGGNCPWCGEKYSVEVSANKTDENRTMRVRCTACKKEFYELYIMVGFADENNVYTTGQEEE